MRGKPKSCFRDGPEAQPTAMPLRLPKQGSTLSPSAHGQGHGNTRQSPSRGPWLDNPPQPRSLTPRTGHPPRPHCPLPGSSFPQAPPTPHRLPGPSTPQFHCALSLTIPTEEAFHPLHQSNYLPLSLITPSHGQELRLPSHSSGTGTAAHTITPPRALTQSRRNGLHSLCSLITSSLN